MYLRDMEAEVIHLLGQNPAVGILGPRSIGKTTLALAIAKKYPHIYLDLEKPEDYKNISKDSPSNYFKRHKDKLLILDEVQACPDLFESLRGVIDAGIREGYGKGRFLILGSGSQTLIHQSSQTLAERIAYITLTGLSPLEVEKSQDSWSKLWFRGGFPLSYSLSSDTESMSWRGLLMESYFRKDMPQFGVKLSITELRKFWVLLAGHQGEPWIPKKYAQRLMIPAREVNHFLESAQDFFLVRVLSPWNNNLQGTCPQVPRVYIRDSGLLHHLWSISEYPELLVHPLTAKSWGGFVIENILSIVDDLHIQPYFYRDGDGYEIDLLLKNGTKGFWAIEIKLSNKKPKVPKGFHRACEILSVQRKFVIYRGEKTLSLSHSTVAISLGGFMELLRETIKNRNGWESESLEKEPGVVCEHGGPSMDGL